MKKLFLILTVIFLLLNQPVNAATFNFIPSADIYYLEGNEYGSNNNSSRNGDYLGVYKASTASFETYLKFNLLQKSGHQIFDITKEKITSASLKLYIVDSNDNTETTSYFVSDDSWNEPLYLANQLMAKPAIDSNQPLGDLNTDKSDYGYKTINLNINIFNNNLDEIMKNNFVSIGLSATGSSYT